MSSSLVRVFPYVVYAHDLRNSEGEHEGVRRRQARGRGSSRSDGVSREHFRSAGRLADILLNRRTFIIAGVDTTRQDLVNKIIHYTVQEVIPRKFKEEVLKCHISPLNEEASQQHLQGALMRRSLPEIVA